MKNVIITGGGGFIGKWMIKELLSHDINVFAIVRKIQAIPKELRNNSRLTLIEADVNSCKVDVLPKVDYDVFYHFAWAGVASKDKNNFSVQLNNVAMSLKALELCHELGCHKFIAAGTVAEYVFSQDVMDVEKRQTPNDMYGAAKTAAHYFLEVRARQLSQGLIWAVLPSTFGEYREDNNIITYTIKTLLAGSKPSFGKLNQMWDFLYVSEVVRALRLLGELGKVDNTYAIGSGVYKPLREYILVIRDLIDKSLPLGIGERPEMTEQTFSSCVSILKLTRDTGFYPQISFEEGVEMTIEYWKKICYKI